MRCPFCDFVDTQVKDSRPSIGSVKRRRICNNCGAKFTTFERVEIKEIIVTKRNGEKKQFNIDQLRKSLAIAARKRPLTSDQIDSVVAQIVKKVEKFAEGEVTSKMIGQLAVSTLAKVDMVSCVRYASVYKEFNNIEDFTTFINDMSHMQQTSEDNISQD